MNGYGIITAIAERSDGSWQPGPGSVYPALRSLDEEGLIAPDESDEDPRRKVFALTEDGRAYAEAHGDELAQAFVDATTPRRGFREMRREIGQLVVAVEQVVVAGQPAQLEAAQQVLADARRSLYRILAEDETGAAAATGAAPTPRTPATPSSNHHRSRPGPAGVAPAGPGRASAKSRCAAAYSGSALGRLDARRARSRAR